MHTMADRVACIRKIREVALHECRCQWHQVARPSVRIGVAPAGELLGELQYPRPTVSSLERTAFGPIEVGTLGIDVRGSETYIEQAANGRGLRQLRMELHRARQQPVRMYARMPIETAEERGVQSMRRSKVRGVADHVIELGRKLALDVRQRDPRVAARVSE